MASPTQDRRLTEIDLTRFRVLIDRCDNWADCLRWRQHAGLSVNPTLNGNVDRIYYPKERGFYTSSPQIWEAVPTPPPDPDQRDAEAIENAVCSLDLFHHGVLRYHHVNKLEPPVTLRLASKMAGTPRAHPAAWIPILLMAYGLLEEALSLPATIRKARALARVMAALED